MPAGGFERVAPRLLRDADGLLRPRADSPATDSAEGEYPPVEHDLDGQPRHGTKDRGADEISTAPAVAAPVTEEAVRRSLFRRDG